MTTYRNSFEGGSNGVALSGSNMAGASGDQPTTLVFTNGSTGVFSTAQSAHGVLSALVTNSSTGAGSVAYGGMNSTAVASRIYLRLSALPTADMTILRHRDAASGTIAVLKFISTGAIRLTDQAGTTIWTSGTLPSVNTWIRYDLFTDIANNQMRAAYGTLDSVATADSNLLSAVGGGVAVATVALGKVTGVYATSMYMDDLAVDDAATGLIAAGIPAGALSVIQNIVPSSGTIPFGVTATATASGGTGTAKLYSWDWADGGTTAAQSSNVAAHTFTVDSSGEPGGVYSVVVTVVNT